MLEYIHVGLAIKHVLCLPVSERCDGVTSMLIESDLPRIVQEILK